MRSCDERRALWAALIVIGAAVSACDDQGAEGEATQPDAGVSTDAMADVDAGAEDGLTQEQRDCDSLMPAHCALPWPSNKFLAEDTTTGSGYRLEFGDTTLIANRRGQRAKPEIFAHLDGYGVSTSVVTVFPSVDISQMATERDMGVSLDPASPTIWLEVDEAGAPVKRVPHWAEFDQNEDDPAKRTLFLRPGVILKEGTRYIVAFRQLQDTSGEAIQPSTAFASLVAGATEADPVLGPRQRRFDEVFDALEQEGVERESLTLAWDFVTNTSGAVHGRMLEVRERGFEAAGERGPKLTVEQITEQTPEEDEHWWLEIEGAFEAPRFTVTERIDGSPGPVLHIGDDGRVVQNDEAPTREATFWVRVPHSARDASPHGLIQYGHGLLGSGEEVDAGYNGDIANDHGFIFFSANLTGMAGADIGNALNALKHVGLFPFLADRLHQGLLEYLLLARSMRERLADAPELAPFGLNINTDELFYSGISQGGIFGAAYLALSEDITLGHLGVPGNNYSLLLQRSRNFDVYFNALRGSYPETVDQTLAIEIIQLLWDQTDPVSYLRHITEEPFDGQAPSYALFAPAKGDYQVAALTNEIAARSDIGIPLMENYGRDVYGVEEQPYPYTGSGIVLYDYGNPWPAPGNKPPSDEVGDPHSKPRRADFHQRQMVHFFRSGGEVIDVCGGDGCAPD